jgi:hypothetical protein
MPIVFYKKTKYFVFDDLSVRKDYRVPQHRDLYAPLQ